MAEQVDLRNFAWGDLDFQPPFSKGAPFIRRAEVPGVDPKVIVFEMGKDPELNYWIMVGGQIIVAQNAQAPYRPKFFSLIEAICWLHMHLNPEEETNELPRR